MAGGIFQPVFFICRIEMAAGAGKLRPLAFPRRVDMNGMKACRKILHSRYNDDSLFVFTEVGSSSVQARGVFELCVGRGPRLGVCARGPKDGSRKGEQGGD